MKKIGQISDTALLRQAGKDQKKIAAVTSVIKTKVAMLNHLVTVAEQQSATRLKPEVKRELVTKAAALFPAKWMLKEEQEVVKAADALLNRLFAAGLDEHGKALYDTKKTAEAQLAFLDSVKRKEAATDNIDHVTPIPGEGFDTPMESEEEIIARLWEELGEPGMSPTPTQEEGVYDAQSIMDQLSAANGPLVASPDLSNPDPDIFKFGSADMVDKYALATFKKISDLVDLIKKKAEVADSIPTDSGKNESAAEKTETDVNKTVETKPETGASIVTPAGEDADYIAAASELENLMKPEGAEGTEKTNPVSSVNAVASEDSAEKLKGDGKNVTASSNNVFSSYIKKIVK